MSKNDWRAGDEWSLYICQLVSGLGKTKEDHVGIIMWSLSWAKLPWVAGLCGSTGAHGQCVSSASWFLEGVRGDDPEDRNLLQSEWPRLWSPGQLSCPHALTPTLPWPGKLPNEPQHTRSNNYQTPSLTSFKVICDALRRGEGNTAEQMQFVVRVWVESKETQRPSHPVN